MTEQQHLTHIDEKGDVRMVDVSEKDITKRVAVAEGFISMHPDTLALIVEARRRRATSWHARAWRAHGCQADEHAHPHVPSAQHHQDEGGVRAGARRRARRWPRGHPCDHTCGVTGKTGIEMEALHAVSAALLTIYDMCKAVDRGMQIVDIMLLEKDGGKSGHFIRQREENDK